MTKGHVREELQSPVKSTQVLTLRWRGNGTSAPTDFTGGAEYIRVITRVGVGIYTVELKPEFAHWQTVFAQGAAELEATADVSVETEDVNPLTGKITVNIYTAGSLADIAAGAGAGNWISVVLFAKYGTGHDGSGYHD